MTLFNARVGFWMGKDAAADPAFAYEDLGNALRKVRIDFKIPITFDETRMRLRHERKNRCAIARINYSAVDGPCEARASDDRRDLPWAERWLVGRVLPACRECVSRAPGGGRRLAAHATVVSRGERNCDLIRETH